MTAPSAPDPFAKPDPSAVRTPAAAAGPPSTMGDAPAVAPYGAITPADAGAIGKVRSTGTCILLSIVTLGIYQYVYYFKVHTELKRHTGAGLGGGIALLIALAFGIAMPFFTSSEVGGLYTRRGQTPPVTGLTGLWVFPGALIIVGPIVWFVKTNGALNTYWRSLGAA